MDFELTPEQQAVKARATAFVDEVCKPLEDSWAYDDLEMDPVVVMSVTKQFREYGLRGLSIPKEVGGLGLGTIAKCLVYEELMTSHVMHGGLMTWTGVTEPHPGLYVAPQWQREKYLDPMLQDERFFAIHISEPGAGSDAAGITTTAVRRGNDYVINGLKRWGPPPHHPAIKPDYLLTYAVTDPTKGHKGISLFLVDYPNPGVTVTNEYETIGTGYLGQAADWEYKDCTVPAENILGVEGGGFSEMMDQLNRNRVVICARLLGTAQWAQKRAIARAKERVAFGSPIGERQAVQWMIAESEMELAQLRWMIYNAAWMLDNGIDARKEVAMAKAAAPVIGCNVIDRAIQIHGGLGLIRETRLAQVYAECRIAQVAEGSTEMMKMTIAREAMRASS